MLEAKKFLEALGHICVVPEGTEEYASGRRVSSECSKRKIEHDLIRKHWREIELGDAILVVNCIKNGIENYIGGNTFLEMGFAYILNKKMFLLNPVPEIRLIRQEVVAMQPIALNGDLSRIS